MKNKYIITTHGEIRALGGINGPITSAIELTEEQVKKLIADKVEFYQCNPYDTNERVKVTYANWNRIYFSRKRPQVRMEQLKNRHKNDINRRIKPMHKDGVEVPSKDKEDTVENITFTKKNKKFKKDKKKNKNNQQQEINKTEPEELKVEEVATVEDSQQVQEQTEPQAPEKEADTVVEPKPITGSDFTK